MRLAFDDVQSFVPSAQVAAHALERSRRRRIVKFYEVALAIAMVVTLFFFGAVRRGRPTVAVATVTETFQLRCLSPEHVAELLRAFASPAAVIRIPPRVPEIITIRTSPEDMQKVRGWLDHFDNPVASTCAVTVPVPKTP